MLIFDGKASFSARVYPNIQPTARIDRGGVSPTSRALVLCPPYLSIRPHPYPDNVTPTTNSQGVARTEVRCVREAVAGDQHILCFVSFRVLRQVWFAPGGASVA